LVYKDAGQKETSEQSAQFNIGYIDFYQSCPLYRPEQPYVVCTLYDNFCIDDVVLVGTLPQVPQASAFCKQAIAFDNITHPVVYRP
jgi:hypothetical protein